MGSSKRMADAQGTLRLAEMRLADARKAGITDSTRIAGLEESVARARRNVASAADAEANAMARAEAKARSAADAVDNLDTKNKNASRSGSALITAIAALGPALVPLAAGATAGAIGFGALGAAGILAIGGIKREMAAGTAVGFAYTTGLATLSGNLHTLQSTAARGVLAPFSREVTALQSQMPFLNHSIGDFSVLAGKTAGNVMSGLIQSFHVFEPLARDVGTYLFQLSGASTR